MLSRDLRFTGFSSSSWIQLLALLGVDLEPHNDSQPVARGFVVVVENADGSPCAAFHSLNGSFVPDGYNGRADLPELCSRQLARRGVIVRRGAIEELTERAAPRVLGEDDYVAQWLALLGTLREIEREGLIEFWPARTPLPLPSANMVTRALDIVLPDDHSFLAVVWDGTEICTALVVRRHASEIDLIAGAELIMDVTGPLGGDYRRDHRALRRAVSEAIAPVHIGVFAQRDHLMQLLRDPRPGAWTKAVAVRDVIIDPAPAYVNVALAADMVRASARKASEWLGGFDFLAGLEPIARAVRDQVSQVSSVSALLGWNPLQLLAQKLRDHDRR
ncbi:MAG TPA: hypothetical protein VF331_00550 [Polyangiales bacterium]